jgi:hypothetical protein
MNDVARFESGNELMSAAATQGAQELFVINLCASMTPMPTVPKNLKGFEKYKLYQVSRQEDGRRRFRLRLGFFTSEADAEWVLNSVRSLYPAAFTGCVTTEDLRYTSDVIPSARTPAQSAPTAPSPATHVNNVPAASTGTIRTAAPASSKPVASSPVAVPAAPAKPSASMTASVPVATPQKAPETQAHGQPFHVGRGVQLPEINLELTDEYEIPAALTTPSKTTPAQTASQPTALATHPVPAASKPNVAASRTTSSAPANEGPIRSATIVTPPKVVDDYVPILDTTLTIRMLTKTEADDPNRPKWFAVQLALSEQPINLETMPKLDIFAAYTLYCVAVMEGGTIKHALRLGFFRENVSAEAVMGYLKAFFNMPSINQISTAEFERFSEPKPKPTPVAGPEAKVVSLDAKRPGAPIKPAVPSAAQSLAPKPIAKPASKPTANGKPVIGQTKARDTTPVRPHSFLSRLIGRQLD